MILEPFKQIQYLPLIFFFPILKLSTGGQLRDRGAGRGQRDFGELPADGPETEQKLFTLLRSLDQALCHRSHSIRNPCLAQPGNLLVSL